MCQRYNVYIYIYGIPYTVPFLHVNDKELRCTYRYTFIHSIYTIYIVGIYTYYKVNTMLAYCIVFYNVDTV